MSGIAIGPIAGGLLLSHFWWGSVFLVNIPIVVLSVPLLGVLVPESKNPAAARLDFGGMLLSTAGLASILWATINAPEHGWASAASLGTYALGAVLLVVFVVFELHNPLPLLDVRFFAERAFVVPTVVVTTVMFMAASFSFVLTQLLQFVHGYSPLQAGVRMLPLAAVLIAGSVVSPRLATRFGARNVIIVGLLLEGAGGVLLSRPGPHGAYLAVMVGMIVHGAGQAVGFSPAVGMAMAAVPKERAGVAAGTNATARQSGAALGVAVGGSVLASAYGADLRRRIGGLGLPADVARRSEESIGTALRESARLAGPAQRALAAASREAFVVGGGRALVVNAGLCLVSAVVFLFLAGGRPTGSSPARDAEETAHARSDP
jgi:MFS family permease